MHLYCTFQCSRIRNNFSVQSKSTLLFWIRIRFLVFWIRIRFSGVLDPDPYFSPWIRIRFLVFFIRIFFSLLYGSVYFSLESGSFFLHLDRGLLFWLYYDSFICFLVYLWSLAPFFAEEKQPRTAQHFMFLWITLISRYIHTLNNHIIIYYQIRNI